MESAKAQVEVELSMVEYELEAVESLLIADPIDKSELNVQYTFIQRRIESLNRCRDAYYKLLLQANRTEEYKSEKSRELTLDKRCTRIEIQCQAALKSNSQSNENGGGSSSGGGNGGGNSSADNYRMNLPRRNLPQFTGDVREWLNFWASFEEIHKDPNIPVAEKFHFLRDSCVPETPARKAINCFPVTVANYPLAVDHLKENFGRENMLIKVYIRDLLSLVIENSKENSNRNFTDLVANLTAQLRNLEMLGVTKDKCGVIMYPIVESCIPRHILKDWMKSKDFEEDIDKLLEYLRNEVKREIETGLAQDPFSSASSSKSDKKQTSTKPEQNKKRDKATVSSLLSTSSEQGKVKVLKCAFCDGGHTPVECMKAVSLSMEDRKAALQKKGCCFRCLRKGHGSAQCKTPLRCPACSGRHFAIMCDAIATCVTNKKEDTSSDAKPSSSSSKNDGNSVSSLMNNCFSPLVPLQTLRLLAHGPNGKVIPIRCILDGGNQRSYVREAIAKELNLKEVSTDTYSHELFGGKTTRTFTYSNVKILVSDIKRNDKCEFEVSVKDCISSHVDIPSTGPWTKEFNKRGIYFSDLSSDSEEIDLLIGNKLIHKVMTGRKCTLDYGPGALETRWGWVLSGEIPTESRRQTSSLLVTSLHVVDRPLSDLWALETLGITDNATTQSKQELEEETMKHFKQNVVCLDNGRYEVKLPFFIGAQQSLPNNRLIAEKRLAHATKQLQANGYLQKYHEIFQTWLKDDMIEAVSLEEDSQSSHYLPHRPVIRLSSTTTPIRPVFDASCKAKGKPSLNESLEVGPNLLELIPKLITRFRLHRIGITSDIRKAFQQISVSPAHRDYLRFLWWEDTTCKKLAAFRHKRVVFGVSCSPFLLGATLQHHLSSCLSSQFDTATAIKKSLYVDNCVISVSSKEKAAEFKDTSMALLNTAHFELRCWEIGPVEQEKIVPVLGLLWNTKHDYLTIDNTSVLSTFEEKYTQRKLLSVTHMLFDPMGWICPFLLPAKQLLRECHKLKLGWDKELPQPLEDEFKRWAKQINALSEIKIPRYIGTDDAVKLSLHAFGDASGTAYAAAVYIRLELPASVIVQLLEARSKVTPPQKITIPRLELLSCLISTRLTASVVEALEFPDIPITYWTDSATALAWIKGDGPWAVFVHNRVEEIRNKTNLDDWRHIPGKCNPADLPSRGCSASRLIKSRWWEGPDWLYLEEYKWPVSNDIPEEAEVKREMRKTVVTMLSTTPNHPLLNLVKWANYDGVLRIIAYIRRFIYNLRHLSKLRSNSRSDCTGAIGPDKNELDNAEKSLLRIIQLELKENINNAKKLQPYLDEEGLIHIKSRLTHDDDELFKFPLLLPENNPFVQLLIYQEHVKTKHGGVTITFSCLREKYWVINGRRMVSKVVKSCPKCRIFNSKRLTVTEAPLPSVRSATAAPFSTTGIDMAGPLLLRGGTKVWIALFTCAVYRGLHLEVVDTLSTDGFLAALRRFTSRRGRPNIIFSDNGLNFVGASKFFKILDWKQVEQYATTERITWRFNPPLAPWWGGWWERLIGILKQLIRRNLGNKTVELPELITLLCELENVMNSRPLTYLSENTDDPCPLTPNHFLRNAALSYLPELDLKDGKSANKAFKKVQMLRETLRSRFRREYLGQLLHMGHTKSIQIKPGDVVLVEVDNQKRVEWPLAVVTEAIHGKDGVVRTYRVRTKGGVITRAAQRLFPLEIRE